ncbi:hypothetical protein DI53_2058 [Sphingobacterium deserti]|uniref:Uncharacterized protein n=1 Tax=Sphingobacterium deserti TaxID=1229276 RepID=A0A0B8T483_9SPHI|nr:hypothetical protein DI53_2058 [Sphingobacterium deserti]
MLNYKLRPITVKATYALARYLSFFVNLVQYEMKKGDR